MRVLKSCYVGAVEEEAAAVIKKGGLVVIPTDTLYALATLATDEGCVKRVFLAKGRDFCKPLSIIVHDIGEIGKYAERVPGIERYLPGPYTVLLKRKVGTLPEILTAGQDKIGIRIPDHPLPVKLAKLCGPLTATSANRSGGKNPARMEEVTVAADLAIDDGPTRLGGPSTIVDLSDGGRPRVIKRGERKYAENGGRTR